MKTNKRIHAFIKLGEKLKKISENKNTEDVISFNKIIQAAHNTNPWFTEKNIRSSIETISEMLKEENIEKWLSKYYNKIKSSNKNNNVGVVLAGNIPLVGFHDFLCVLISGNSFIGKLSGQDEKLLPAVAEQLVFIEPEFKNKIQFTDNFLKSFDAIIATGSDNTSKYFEYYFGQYPNIIRKNRNSVAVLNGNESDESIKKLGFDLFSYFGLGCRNVSKIYIPEDYDLDVIFRNIISYKDLINHSKYANNYSYYKSIYLLAENIFFDNGFCLLKEDTAFSAPVGVVNYERYKNISNVNKTLQVSSKKIQCVVSLDENIENSIPFGKTQSPDLWDYADGVDTMEFLLEDKIAHL